MSHSWPADATPDPLPDATLADATLADEPFDALPDNDPNCHAVTREERAGQREPRPLPLAEVSTTVDPHQAHDSVTSVGPPPDPGHAGPYDAHDVWLLDLPHHPDHAS